LLKILNITRELKKRKKKEKTTNDTAGLETILKVGIGSRIMLRRNINMEKGRVGRPVKHDRILTEFRSTG
jgi:hypothetical protein